MGVMPRLLDDQVHVPLQCRGAPELLVLVAAPHFGPILVGPLQQVLVPCVPEHGLALARLGEVHGEEQNSRLGSCLGRKSEIKIMKFLFPFSVFFTCGNILVM